MLIELQIKHLGKAVDNMIVREIRQVLLSMRYSILRTEHLGRNWPAHQAQMHCKPGLGNLLEAVRSNCSVVRMAGVV